MFMYAIIDLFVVVQDMVWNVNKSVKNRLAHDVAHELPMDYKKQIVLVAHELPMDFAIFTPPEFKPICS